METDALAQTDKLFAQTDKLFEFRRLLGRYNEAVKETARMEAALSVAQDKELEEKSTVDDFVRRVLHGIA